MTEEPQPDIEAAPELEDEPTEPWARLKDAARRLSDRDRVPPPWMKEDDDGPDA